MTYANTGKDLIIMKGTTHMYTTYPKTLKCTRWNLWQSKDETLWRWVYNVRT